MERTSRASLVVLFLLGCGEPRVPSPPPAAQASATPAEERPLCPPFQELGLRVDRLVEAIRPGVTLQEFTATGDAEQALDFWDEVAGGQRETVFFVGAEEGNAVPAGVLPFREP